MNNEYFVTYYHTNEDTTSEQADEIANLPSRITLEQVVENCKHLHCRAVLRDVCGFKRGHVSSTGDWSLVP